MWAMIVKGFRRVRRDRRTLAMMIVLPILPLVVFGHAASDAGEVRDSAVRPAGLLAWRRGRSWRSWPPDGSGAGVPIERATDA